MWSFPLPSGDWARQEAPFGLAGLASTQVVVEYNGNVSAPMAVPVTNTMPGVFSMDGTGSGQGAIQNADGSLNGAGNPAAAGSIMVLYLEGLGVLNPAQGDGSVVPVSEPWPTLQYPVTVSVGGQPCQIVYQGPAPLSVAGMYQVNCVISPATSSGAAAVVVTSDRRQSQPNLTVAVR